MKAIAFLVALACLATTAFAEPPTVKADRFEGKTTLQTTFTPDISHMLMISAAVKDGKLAEPPTLGLGWYGTEWKYLACHEIHFLVDGKPFPVQAQFQNMMRKTVTIEIEVVPLTIDQLKQLAAASKIEFKVCNDEGALQEGFVKDIKDFVPALDQALKGEAK